jgi:hypothetical protein
MSFSHAGATTQMLQRALRVVQQLRGECVSHQVPDARIGLATNGGAGALFHLLALFGVD